jgi:hypothetical protein
MPYRATAAVWSLCALAALLYALAFYPGLISFDSAYQWWQARSGEVSNINGIGIVALWRLALPFDAGPAPLLLFNLALFWGAVAWIALSVPASLCARLALALLLAAAPASWLLAQIWSDTALLALLLFAVAATLAWRTTGKRRYFAIAIFCLGLGLAQRHNALAAVLPLLWFACGVDRATGAARWRRIGGGLLLGAALLGAVQLAGRAWIRVHYPVLPALTLWDLSRISVHEGRVLLPDYAIAPGKTVADLAPATVSWSNTPLFDSPRAGVRYPFQPWPEADLRRLQRDWLATIAAHPGAYLAHRGALLADLFGTRAAALPRELTYVPGPVQYRDNPPVTANDTALRRAWLGAFEALRATPAFAAWPYLLTGLLAALHTWRRRDAHSAAALWLCASAWAYALPYAVIAPAAEFRYLLWSCIASLVAVWLRFATRGT